MLVPPACRLRWLPKGRFTVTPRLLQYVRSEAGVTVGPVAPFLLLVEGDGLKETNLDEAPFIATFS